MGAGVDAEVDVREYEAVALRVIFNAIDVEFGVTRPVNHAVADGDGEIDPGLRHQVPW